MLSVGGPEKQSQFAGLSLKILNNLLLGVLCELGGK
jgi:hypothetical protein